MAAPFLGSLGRRARAEEIPQPRRLIIMFTPYGCITTRWFPENSNGRLTAEDYQGTSLEVLAPHAKKLLVPRGIRAMNEWTTDVSLGQGNDYHTQVVGTYFTCVPVTPHTSNPFDLNNTDAKFNAMPTAPSLDHVCARQLSPGGVPLLLRVGGANENAQTAISYAGNHERFAGFDAKEAFASLTGLFQNGAPVSPDSYQAVRGQSIIDLVKDDLETLERLDMSSSDKSKLAAWKELLHETTSVMRDAQCNEETAMLLGVTADNVATAMSTRTDPVASKIGDGLDGADLYTNLAVLHALCDLSRVIVLKYPGNYVYSGLGLDFENDGLNHRIGAGGLGGTCVSEINELLLTIDEFHASKFAHLVSQLDAFEDGDVKLLDNSAAVWFHETSDGCAVNLNNMPILQAGSCGGYFKTGCAVNVDDGSPDLHRGNSEALCAEDGASFEPEDFKLFGTPVEFANAPINKYYCNLMNAIGVKAGADGFPAEGGSEPVTHYGMYDRTEDFASGGELPPNISDPGEFEELRGSS